jgi:hypothetical protein
VTCILSHSFYFLSLDCQTEQPSHHLGSNKKKIYQILLLTHFIISTFHLGFFNIVLTSFFLHRKYTGLFLLLLYFVLQNLFEGVFFILLTSHVSIICRNVSQLSSITGFVFNFFLCSTDINNMYPIFVWFFLLLFSMLISVFTVYFLHCFSLWYSIPCYFLM